MGRITIFEGPDGCGKSTLARKLAVHQRANYKHFGPVEEPLIAYLSFLQEWEAKGVPSLVLDRFYPSEHIYGPLLRGNDKLGRAWARMIDRVLLSHQVVMVRCHIPVHHAIANFHRSIGRQLPRDAEQYRQLYQAYAEYEPTLPWVTYNYMANPEPGPFFFTQLNGCRAPANKGPGAGMFEHGAILMVGDRPGRSSTDTHNWPFCSWRGVSPWFAERMEEAGIDERRFYWVNAKNRSGQETSAAFIRDLLPSAVVALGKKAEAWCRKHGLECHLASHPSYHRVYRTREPYELIDLLRTL